MADILSADEIDALLSVTEDDDFKDYESSLPRDLKNIIARAKNNKITKSLYWDSKSISEHCEVLENEYKEIVKHIKDLSEIIVMIQEAKKTESSYFL